MTEVFSAALDIDAAARRDFVLAEFLGDLETATEVLRLLDLHEEAEEFLEVPVFRLLPQQVDTILRSGDLVAGRFEIVRLRGRGGMGEVYEAQDRVLHEAVALKIMRPEIGDAETMAARFRTEAQLARRISHPAVCRVHDVTFDRSPDRGDLIVLTMELLCGETLAERLSRGALPPGEAHAIAQQVGAALDAAHALRIVHGDVKPENVILADGTAGRPRVVLTDFGLARAFETELAGATTEGRPRFGTPAYMAPEQLRGGGPTTASDLFALALLVVDMVTGRRRSTGEAPHPLPDGPRWWRRVIARGTHPNPARRFPTAAAMMARLSPAQRRRRRATAAAGIAAAALALFAAWLRIYGYERPALRPASELLVVDTENRTGNTLFDGSSELLRAQLAQSPHFNLVSADRVRATLQQMRRPSNAPMTPALAREIALRQAAALVLYSTIVSAGHGFRLNVELEHVGPRPSFARAHWTREFEARDAGELLVAAHHASLWARQMTGETPAQLTDQDRPPSETTTSSWEALRLFAKANQLQSQGQSTDAILLLEDALSIDPDFATAQMRRADILIGLGRDVEGYAAWRDAIRLGEKRQVTGREYLRIRAQYFQDAGEWVEAEKAYRKYVVHYPNDADAAFLLGSVLRMRGQTPEAIAWCERALQLRPGWFIPLVHLATGYLDSGRPQAAHAAISRLRAEGLPDYAAWLEGIAALGQGDVERALRAIEPLRASADPVWTSRGFSLRAAWLTEAGREAAAVPELLTGIDFDRAHGLQGAEADKWLQAGYLYERRRETNACADAANHAITIAANAARVMHAGVLLAGCGRVAEAGALLRFFETQPAVPRVTVARHRLESAIALARGHARGAVDLAVRASGADSAYPARLYLARALGAAGDRTGAAAAIEADLREPTRLYRSPEPPIPGIWRACREFHDSLTDAR